MPRNPSSCRRACGCWANRSRCSSCGEMIAKVARSQAPVHIAGDSGTGKELVARLIHDTGPRHDGPFVPVNCGAIPSELMESELFGHKKGSFTGAVADKEGLIQLGRGRHAVPGRSRGPAAAHAGEAAARDPGEVRPAGGRNARDAGRRARAVGDAPQARRAGEVRQVPRGPVLPHQRHRAAGAGIAGTPR